MNEKIGFIGLGAMGNPMAANLSKAGNTVYVYDVSEQAVQRACDENDKMIACDTLTFLAENSDIIFASLPNGPIVTSVMQNEIIGSCKRDTIIVDLSSVAPETSKTLYSLAKEKGVEYLDAPVSGGVSGAVAGTLTLMVGGDKEVFDRAVSILECIGKNILYIGEIGSGDAMKLVNNLMLGCNMAAAAEAIVLGQRCGIDLETIKKVITISSGNSYAFQAKIDKFIIPEKYDGGFAVSLQHKDLGLALEAAENVKMSLRMGEAATGVFETAMSEGYSGRDISSVTEMWQNHFNAN